MTESILDHLTVGLEIILINGIMASTLTPLTLISLLASRDARILPEFGQIFTDLEYHRCLVEKTEKGKHAIITETLEIGHVVGAKVKSLNGQIRATLSPYQVRVNNDMCVHQPPATNYHSRTI